MIEDVNDVSKEKGIRVRVNSPQLHLEFLLPAVFYRLGVGMWTTKSPMSPTVCKRPGGISIRKGVALQLAMEESVWLMIVATMIERKIFLAALRERIVTVPDQL